MAPILGIYASQISGHLVTNSYASIQTVTVGSGGASSITFSSIPSTYTHLQLRVTNLTSGTFSADIKMQFNSDTGNNYSRHLISANGSSIAAVANTSNAFIDGVYNGDATYPYISIIDIFDYSNSNKYKTTKTLNGGDRNGSGYVNFNSGLWMNTSVISSIIFTPNSGNINQYSSFALYGVK